jgi:hypothetical protein
MMLDEEIDDFDVDDIMIPNQRNQTQSVDELDLESLLEEEVIEQESVQESVHECRSWGDCRRNKSYGSSRIPRTQ